MRIKSKAAIAGISAAGLIGAALTAAPEASAAPVGPTLTQGAPVTVYQIPAIGLQVSGLVVPAPWPVGVAARSAGPGQVELSSPQSPSTCATNASGAYLNVGFINLATGQSGATTFAPCGFFGSLPTSSVVTTGSGPVAITVGITGSPQMPNAGQPSLPGGGGFMAP